MKTLHPAGCRIFFPPSVYTRDSYSKRIDYLASLGCKLFASACSGGCYSVGCSNPSVLPKPKLDALGNLCIDTPFGTMSVM